MTEAASPRRRDSADSRRRLLEAAAALFAARGYHQTTLREVGQRAGVDPALIARYFGSKAELYLAALRRDVPGADDPFDFSDTTEIRTVLERDGPGNPSPTLFAAVRPHEDATLQTAAMDVLRRRMIDPWADRAADDDLQHARLRAETAVAALAGIVLSRRSGALPELANADPDELGALIEAVFDALLRG
jgi:AcrR family transcriptional regulator